MEDVNNNEYYEIDLLGLFKVLLRKWYVILFTTLIVLGGGIYYVSTIEASYTVNSSVVVEMNSEGQSEYSDVLMAQKLVGTYKELILSDTVLSQVAEDLTFPMSVKEVKNSISVKTVGDTLIIGIEATTNSKITSYELVHNTVNYAVEASNRFESLKGISVLDEAQVSETADPDNGLLYIVVAGLLGAFIGSSLIIVRELMNTKIRGESDIDQYLGVKVLAVIPTYNSNKLKK